MDAGGREIKVVAEEMNDVARKGHRARTRLDGREKNLLGEFEFDKEKILSVLRENDTR